MNRFLAATSLLITLVLPACAMDSPRTDSAPNPYVCGGGGDPLQQRAACRQE